MRTAEHVREVRLIRVIGFKLKASIMKIAWISISLLLGLSSLAHSADAAPQFADDFATLRPGWGATDDMTKVDGNRLLFDLKPGLVGHRLYEDRFVDADIRVRVTEVRGETNQPGGIVFWAVDRGNFYLALLQADGVVYVARRMNGKWLLPVAQQIHAEVRKGIGQENELRVATSGPTATIYVNDQVVTRFRGFPPTGGSRVGLHGEAGMGPAAWAFADFRVYQGPAPAAGPNSADESLLLADDFSTLDPGWGRIDANQRVDENRLVVSIPPTTIRRTLFNGMLFDDVDLRVRLSEIGGDVDQPAGVIFWAEDLENHYAALLRADGGFLVARRVKGRWLNPVGLQARAEVRRGLGSENELRVVTAGRSATIYINDQAVTTFQGSPPASGSKIGVQTESGRLSANWAFSHLSVRRGPAPSAEESIGDPSLLMADDFSRLDPGWRANDDYEATREHKLIVNLLPDRILRELHRGFLFDDADIRINIAQTAGGTDRLGGIIFWAADGENHYSALLKADGNVLVARRQNGRWTNPVGLRACEAIRRGLGQENQLRVVTSGRVATLYVNDQLVTSFQGFPPSNGSMVGLHAESGADSAVWAFSELRVSAAPPPATGARVRDAALLLADDFDVLDPAWGHADAVQHVDHNRLLMAPKHDTTYTSLFQGGLFDDVDVRVNVTLVQGGTEQSAGIVFWATDYNNLYVARLFSDGTFGVSRCVEGKWDRAVPDKVLSDINQGLNQRNELRVVTRGDQAWVFINNREVAEFKGLPPKGGSFVGLRAASAADAYTWAFSALRIRRAPAAADVVLPAPQRLPDAIVEAWADSGAKSCWMRINEFGVPQFVMATGADIEGRPGDLPAFRLALMGPAKFDSLPSPPTAFGLLIFSSAADVKLHDLARFTNLRGLSILDPRLPDAGLNGLADLSGLQTLQLGCPQLTDVSLKALSGLSQLQSLTLTCPQASDEALAAVAGLTKLHTLNIAGSRLTDAGLSHLVGMTELQRLNLNETKITDAGLKLLSGLKMLKSLDVGGTPVTDEGVRILQQTLPDCEIKR